MSSSVLLGSAAENQPPWQDRHTRENKAGKYNHAGSSKRPREQRSLSRKMRIAPRKWFSCTSEKALRQEKSPDLPPAPLLFLRLQPVFGKAAPMARAED